MTNYKGSCHCGNVTFEINGKIENIVECNCSICTIRGHLLWFVPKTDIKFTKGGDDAMGAYQFGKKHITHRFCKNCGTSMMSDGEQQGAVKAGINIKVLLGVDVTLFDTYKYDGAKL
ncbi:MAG: GFA family protein [Rhizobiales bacterium]|nr:GFA family protein [Hyphomicrobiales bacterium]